MREQLIHSIQIYSIQFTPILIQEGGEKQKKGAELSFEKYIIILNRHVRCLSKEKRSCIERI